MKNSLTLKSGNKILVDACNSALLSENGWREHVVGRTSYVRRRKYIGKKHGKYVYEVQYLHRLIMNPPKGMVIDHVDGNGLNNRRKNLRICTRAQNLSNQRKQHGCSSKYKGVTYHPKTGGWYSQIKFKKQHIYLGYFKKEEDAAIAYNTSAIKYFGKFAKLNNLYGRL
jgi:hypothetical protein